MEGLVGTSRPRFPDRRLIANSLCCNIAKAATMCDPPNSMANQGVHEANKREAFDGMRAYHQSEIAHKKDAIEILKAVLATTVIIYGGLLSAVMTVKIYPDTALYAAIAIAAMVGIASSLIVGITNRKIDEDNKRYRKYREEYVLERRLIGLEKDLRASGYISAWNEEHDPNRTGYHHTKNILRALGWIIFVVAVVGVFFVHFARGASDKHLYGTFTQEVRSSKGKSGAF